MWLQNINDQDAGVCVCLFVYKYLHLTQNWFKKIPWLEISIQFLCALFTLCVCLQLFTFNTKLNWLKNYLHCVCNVCFYVDRQHLWQSQSVSGTSSNSTHSRWNHKWRRSHWTHSSMDSSPEPGGTTLQQRAVFSIFSRRRCLLLLPFGLLGLSLFLLLCQLARLSGITPAATRSFWWATLLMLQVGQGVWVTVDVSVGLVLG